MTRHRTSSLSLLALSIAGLLAAGCDGAPAAAPTDAGTSGARDASPSPDAGEARDAAVTADSGEPPAAIGFFTDLASAPAGAQVTAYGHGFGSSGAVTLGGVAQTVISYADGEVVFTASGPGGDLVVGGVSMGPLPIHVGRVLDATPATLADVWRDVQPGDEILLATGIYDATYGEGTWFTDCTLETYVRGTATQPIAVVARAGDDVTWHAAGSHSPICLGDQNHGGRADWLTFAGFDIVAPTTCVDGGGDTTDPDGGIAETGATNIRLVGLRCEITDVHENTLTGMVSLQGDGWRIYGNRFLGDPAREIYNNNHCIYVSGGADDVDIGYNGMERLRMGHVVQVHQDGITPFLYEGVSIHDNHFTSLDYGDTRGISVVNVDDASTVTISRNVFRHLGQDGWGCINVYRGVIRIDENDCSDTQGGVNLNGGYGGTVHVTMTDNTICPVPPYEPMVFEGGPTSSDVVETGRRPCHS